MDGYVCSISLPFLSCLSMIFLAWKEAKKQAETSMSQKSLFIRMSVIPASNNSDKICWLLPLLYL